MPFETTASRLWRSLPREARERAARHFWEHPPEEVAPTAAREVVNLLKIRPQAFGRLSAAQRERALAGLAQTPEPVAEALLVALHLAERRPLLAAFLDTIGVAHEEGLIAEDAEVPPLTAEAARQALATLRAGHPADELRVYWNALWLQDRERWAGLAALADEI